MLVFGLLFNRMWPSKVRVKKSKDGGQAMMLIPISFIMARVHYQSEYNYIITACSDILAVTFDFTTMLLKAFPFFYSLAVLH